LLEFNNSQQNGGMPIAKSYSGLAVYPADLTDMRDRQADRQISRAISGILF